MLLLAGAGLLPLLLWGLLGRSLLEGALAVAPPLGSLLGTAAEALDGDAHDLGRRRALAAELRDAELHLVQADLARRLLLERAPLSFLLALGASAVLVALVAWVLGRRISRPVETLAAGMARFGRGELEHEVPVSGRGDELDYLAVELNRMGRELARQRRRLQVSEALAAWRDAARALAHDLKNPLTAMRMALGRLTRPGRSEAAFAEAVSLLQDELDVLIRMSQSFTEFARLPAPQPRLLDLGALCSDVAALYEAECQPARLTVALGACPAIHADADQLRRALGNLVKNAIEASRGQSGPIEIAVAAGDDPDHVRVVVSDEGTGIAAPLEGADLMSGLRSAKAGGERGLGLPIAHKIIHDHGGRLRLVPRPQRGTHAVIDLPVALAAGPAAATSAPPRSEA